MSSTEYSPIIIYTCKRLNTEIDDEFCSRLGVMVFITTFNNISVT